MVKIIASRKRREKKEENPMIDVILKYMNTNVLVKTVESTYIGKLVRSEENWIVLFEGEKKGENAINIDYVTSIRPYKGKIR